MTPLDFLRAVWPETGLYCLAYPYVPEDQTKSVYGHHTAKTIIEALSIAQSIDVSKDAYFAVHTLQKEQWWNERKQIHQTRCHANMAQGKTLFLDLDVGKSTDKSPKYETREAALVALEKFLFLTSLPYPIIVSSGGGYHIYWPFAEPLASDKWRVLATRFYHVVRKFGMVVDPARTNDQSSVLRVPGTTNKKAALGGKTPVEIVHEGDGATAIERIGLMIDILVGGDQVNLPKEAPVTAPASKFNRQEAIAWQGEETTFEELMGVCARVTEFAATNDVQEPYYYNVAGGLIQYVEYGREIVQELSIAHKHYSADTSPSWINDKLDQWKANSTGPSSCQNIDSKCGGDTCTKCPHFKDNSAPFKIAAKIRKATPAAPPIAPQPLNALPQAEPIVIPDPPYPFSRVEVGVMMHIAARGEEAPPEDIIIAEYDLYPIEVLEKTQIEGAYSRWMVKLPLTGYREIRVTASQLFDISQLGSLLFNEGVIIKGKMMIHVREYMSAYLRTLQAAVLSNRQYDHFGWVDDYGQFVLPDLVLSPTEPPKAAVISNIARELVPIMGRKGTLEKQIELMEFYNKDRYVRHQALICASLAAPLLIFTGQYGVIVSASGETGGSKTTGLYAAAANWGNPAEFCLSGLKKQGTAYSQIARLVTTGDLPFCIDEMTRMDVEDIKDLALSVSQPIKDRRRLFPDGSPKPLRGHGNATMLLCTSNGNLQGSIATENAGGLAGAMRVLEIAFPKAPEDPASKDAADQFLRELKQNYGHIGPYFVHQFMPHLDVYKKLVHDTVTAFDKKMNISGSERYFSAGMTMMIIGCSEGNRLGILPFQKKLLLDWLRDEELPYLRGVIKDEKDNIDPVTILANYIETINGDMIKVFKHVNGAHIPQYVPKGEMKAHYDMGDRSIWIRRDAFRMWCERTNRSAATILRELHARNIITNIDIKKVLGGGTGPEHAKVRSACFIVDMNHAELRELAEKVVEPIIPANVIPLNNTRRKA
jgi:hypothetical protein